MTLTNTVRTHQRGKEVSSGSDTAARAELNDHLAQAYEEHFEFVWRSLRRLGVPENMLEDATQDEQAWGQ